MAWISLGEDRAVPGELGGRGREATQYTVPGNGQGFGGTSSGRRSDAWPKKYFHPSGVRT
jgi:hypothetical protein